MDKDYVVTFAAYRRAMDALGRVGERCLREMGNENFGGPTYELARDVLQLTLEAPSDDEIIKVGGTD